MMERTSHFKPLGGMKLPSSQSNQNQKASAGKLGSARGLTLSNSDGIRKTRRSSRSTPSPSAKGTCDSTVVATTSHLLRVRRFYCASKNATTTASLPRLNSSQAGKVTKLVSQCGGTYSHTPLSVLRLWIKGGIIFLRSCAEHPPGRMAD